MNVQFISPEQAQRAMVLNWTATQIATKMGLQIKVPTALVGDTGCGKTDAVKAFHHRLDTVMRGKTNGEKGTHLWNIRMSHILPEDLGGYAAKDETTKKLVHYMLDCLPFDTDDTGVIFLDEFDRAPSDNQNAALPLVYGDEFHGHKISSNAYVVLALNGQADNYTTPLSKAARTRVCSLYVSRNAADGLKSYDDWAAKNNIPAVVRYFHANSGQFIRSNQEYEEMAECTSRTLDMAGMITLAKNHLEEKGGVKVSDIYAPCLAGVIGQQAASQYLVNERLMNQYDIDAVLTAPETISPPHYSMIQYVVDAVCHRVHTSQNKTWALNVLKFADSLRNEEWRKVIYDRMADSYPPIITLPEYTRHLNRR